MEDVEPDRAVKTTNTVFDIVEILDERGGAGVTELADELNMAPSTVHKHLMTLVSNGYIVKEGYEYKIALKFLSIGMNAKRTKRIVEIVRPFLKQVAQESGELAWFVEEEHGYAVFLDKAMGEYAVQPYSQLGGREHLHHSASGKAILAFLPEDKIEKVIELRGLKKLTENTVTDAEQLRSELARIRDRGYAFNRGETVENHRAVASPILHNRDVMGSIVISGPEKRMTGDYFENDLPNLISGTTNAIELELKKQMD
ncbi:IclR family transcriptional regulator [Halopenitus sp. H-Gu1]|uniref:IclR family transcriptional regulator n=1 Tax=Halopenitus sp. H-Gu1 TaxID=3242697 RepID=UPI00359DB762